jgi:hypothetical protein
MKAVQRIAKFISRHPEEFKTILVEMLEGKNGGLLHRLILTSVRFHLRHSRVPRFNLKIIY